MSMYKVFPLWSYSYKTSENFTTEFLCLWPWSIGHQVPYFFVYKTEFFSFQNNPKNLDPSYKMDLDLWDFLRRVKLVL